jgi:hypothetical protein
MPDDCRLKLLARSQFERTRPTLCELDGIASRLQRTRDARSQQNFLRDN